MRVALWILAVIACGRSAGPTLTMPRQLPADTIDVDSTNLGAKEELDALLLGLPSIGRPVDPIRVAVPPLRVNGDDRWLGEAAADIVMSQISTARGVIGVDRGELKPVVE